jgi:hypothetical protein
MNKIVTTCLALCAAGFLLQSCNNDETYADQKKKERNAIANFINRDMYILDSDGDTIEHVGKINVITQEQFEANDSVTDLSKNEYVLFENSGVYMQIVRQGSGNKMKNGDNKTIFCRFLEYNIMGDSLQLRNNVLYYATVPDVMSVQDSYGTITGSFTTGDSGNYGAMYSTYGKTTVPTGWLVPLPYVRIGRQTDKDTEIAKVRLIVPHSSGQSDATSNVYPCYYEITYQEGR